MELPYINGPCYVTVELAQHGHLGLVPQPISVEGKLLQARRAREVVQVVLVGKPPAHDAVLIAIVTRFGRFALRPAHLGTVHGRFVGPHEARFVELHSDPVEMESRVRQVLDGSVSWFAYVFCLNLVKVECALKKT